LLRYIAVWFKLNESLAVRRTAEPSLARPDPAMPRNAAMKCHLSNLNAIKMTLPCGASPLGAPPRLAQRCIMSNTIKKILAMLCPAAPYPAKPCLAAPRSAKRCPAVTECHQIKSLPCNALHCLSEPGHALPRPT
jgi:hypothetical protein